MTDIEQQSEGVIVSRFQRTENPSSAKGPWHVIVTKDGETKKYPCTKATWMAVNVQKPWLGQAKKDWVLQFNGKGEVEGFVPTEKQELQDSRFQVVENEQPAPADRNVAQVILLRQGQINILKPVGRMNSPKMSAMLRELKAAPKDKLKVLGTQIGEMQIVKVDAREGHHIISVRLSGHAVGHMDQDTSTQ